MFHSGFYIKRLFLAGIFILTITNISNAQTALRAGIDFPPEIENPEITGINKEAYHSTLMPYANLQEALVAKRHASTYARSLNGNGNLTGYPARKNVRLIFINKILTYLNGPI